MKFYSCHHITIQNPTRTPDSVAEFPCIHGFVYRSILFMGLSFEPSFLVIDLKLWMFFLYNAIFLPKSEIFVTILYINICIKGTLQIRFIVHNFFSQIKLVFHNDFLENLTSRTQPSFFPKT